MPRAEKIEKVKEIKARLGAAQAAVFTDYRGLTVRDIHEVRGSLLEAGAQFSVVKNSLARLAVKDAGLEDLEPLIDGPTAIVFVAGDPVLGTKALVDAAKRFPFLEVRGGLAEGRVLSADQIRELASLKGLDEMLAEMAGMLGAHLSKAAYLFRALQMRFLSLLRAYGETLPEEGTADEAPAAEPSPEEPSGPPPASEEDASGGPSGSHEGPAGETESETKHEKEEEEGA